MALLFRHDDGTYESLCSICEQPLTDPVFATSHFISSQADRLWRYSDSGMHWDCYAAWKYQKRFAKQYFETKKLWKPKNPYWATVAITELFLVTANPNRPEPIVDIDLQEIGAGFRMPISAWTDWINGGWNNSCVHDLQRLAMFDVEDQMREIIPDSVTLMHLAKMCRSAED